MRLWPTVAAPPNAGKPFSPITATFFFRDISMINLKNSRGSVFSVSKNTEIMIARQLLFKQGSVNKSPVTATQQDAFFH